MEPVHDFLQQIDSAHTRRAYQSDLRDFLSAIASGDEDPSLSDISEATLERYVRTMQSRDLSVATQRRRLSALRRFFDWLVDDGTVDRNPARAGQYELVSDTPEDRHGGTETRTLLRPEELSALVKASEQSGEAAIRDRGLIITILYGALRRAEVASLTVEDVRPLGRHWVIDVPSDGEATSGYVKVPETVIEAIDAVQSAYDIGSGFLWRSLSNRNRGAPLTPDAIYKIVRRTGRRAGVGPVSVEDVRQSGLSLAVEAGASFRQVQVHGRLRTLAAVERYGERKGTSGRLTESAVDFLDLDV